MLSVVHLDSKKVHILGEAHLSCKSFVKYILTGFRLSIYHGTYIVHSELFIAPIYMVVLALTDIFIHV